MLLSEESLIISYKNVIATPLDILNIQLIKQIEQHINNIRNELNN